MGNGNDPDRLWLVKVVKNIRETRQHHPAHRRVPVLRTDLRKQRKAFGRAFNPRYERRTEARTTRLIEAFRFLKLVGGIGQVSPSQGTQAGEKLVSGHPLFPTGAYFLDAPHELCVELGFRFNRQIGVQGV